MNVGQLINQNSYAIAGAILIVVVASEVVRREVTLRSIALLTAVAVVLVLPVLWLRSAQTAAGELDAALSSGTPVLVELYSDL